MTDIVSSTNKWEYDNLGFTVIRGAFCKSDAEEIRAELLRIADDHSEYSVKHRDVGDRGYFSIDILMHARSELIKEVALASRAVDIAKSILGEDEIYFFYDQSFRKLPFTSTRTQWHQDLPYWPLRGSEIPSLWIALSDCDENSSAVSYLPGSHLSGIVFEATNHEMRESDLKAGRSVCPEVHEDPNTGSRLRSNGLKCGDVVVHHPLIVHGAGPNNSEFERFALSLRYCSGKVCWDPRPRTMHFPKTEVLRPGTLFSEQLVFPKLA